MCTFFLFRHFPVAVDVFSWTPQLGNIRIPRSWPALFLKHYTMHMHTFSPNTFLWYPVMSVVDRTHYYFTVRETTVYQYHFPATRAVAPSYGSPYIFIYVRLGTTNCLSHCVNNCAFSRGRFNEKNTLVDLVERTQEQREIGTNYLSASATDGPLYPCVATVRDHRASN